MANGGVLFTTCDITDCTVRDVEINATETAGGLVGSGSLMAERM